MMPDILAESPRLLRHRDCQMAKLGGTQTGFQIVNFGNFGISGNAYREQVWQCPSGILFASNL